MTMYATLEEAIDAAREEFLADNPGLRKKMLTCNNSISKNTSYRTVILCGRPNSLLMKVKMVNVCRY
ncbi:acidic protein msyB [Enterobacter hormaechei]|nr:acidic protein msyB [Enterobacter hormaechei]